MNPTAITFTQAKEFVMPMGKHIGKTLDAIATTDDGLAYLDWFSGQVIRSPDLRAALKAYLSDPTIAADVMKLVRDKR